MAAPKSDDVIAFLQIALTAGGGIAVSGSLGDKKLALMLLDHARDAINAQVKDAPEIVIPNRDVVVAHHPAFPTKPLGDTRA